MSTITITDADVGRTIATNGTLTAIGFMQAPTPGTYAYPDGLLSLVDDANPNGSPRALFHADVTTQWWSPKHPLYKSAHLVHDAQGVSSPLF